MRVIVVDDSRVVRSIISRIMAGLEYQVFEAPNGAEAIEVLERVGPVELALVDWNMPVMSGIEFVRAVRADRRYRDMTIMMVTTETETERVVCALAAGANEYLMKPFDKGTLVSKLDLLGLAA